MTPEPDSRHVGPGSWRDAHALAELLRACGQTSQWNVTIRLLPGFTGHQLVMVRRRDSQDFRLPLRIKS